jgi:flagellar capping protein FliD
MDRRLTQQRQLLESSFIRMEEAQSSIQNQLASLNSAFGSGSGK